MSEKPVSEGSARNHDSGPLALSGFLPYRISVVSECISVAFADRYERQFGLSIPEWRVMAVLGEQSPRSTQEVIVQTEMDRVRVSRAVIRLSDKGLIIRKARIRDQRMQSLQLSRNGAAIYRQIIPLARSLQHELAAALTANEVRIFEQILEKLYLSGKKMRAAQV